MGNGDDFVVGFEAFFEVGGAARDEFSDDAVVLLVHAEHGADADELELHLDVEVLEILGRHVGGVGVVELGDAGEEEFGEVGAFELGDVFKHALVAFADDFAGLFDGFFVQDFGADFEFEAAAPEGVCGGGCLRPLGFGSV